MVKYESPLFDVVTVETEDIILASGGGVVVNPDTGNAEGEGDEF